MGEKPAFIAGFNEGSMVLSKFEMYEAGVFNLMPGVGNVQGYWVKKDNTYCLYVEETCIAVLSDSGFIDIDSTFKYQNHLKYLEIKTFNPPQIVKYP